MDVMGVSVASNKVLAYIKRISSSNFAKVSPYSFNKFVMEYSLTCNAEQQSEILI